MDNCRIKKSNSDAGNRTPSCRVRDGDVNHYTTSDVDEIRLGICFYQPNQLTPKYIT